MSNNKLLAYRQVGDYLIPNLTLPPDEANIHVGKWGRLHKDYLIKHKQSLFTILFSEGQLYSYLANIDRQTQEMFCQLVNQIAEHEGITEQLKEDNQMMWIQKMNYIQNQVNEIVCKELITKVR